jgi:hypothetical protein
VYEKKETQKREKEHVNKNLVKKQKRIKAAKKGKLLFYKEIIKLGGEKHRGKQYG